MLNSLGEMLSLSDFLSFPLLLYRVATGCERPVAEDFFLCP